MRIFKLHQKKFVSIVVPAFNEERYIGRCLASLISLDYPKDMYEIIVVDNCSSDRTLDIANSFEGVVTLQVESGTPSKVRNKGVTKARGQYLAFIDGDCVAPEAWLNVLVAGFIAGNDVVGGPCVSPKDGTWIERAWASTNSGSYSGPGMALPGANLAIRKRIFEQLNGFDEMLETAEDDDLCKRAIELKAKLLNSYRATVIHLGYPKTIGEFSRKIWWHSTSQLRAHGIFSDRVVLLTVIWLIALIGMISQLVVGLPYVRLPVTVIMVIPLLFASKRRRDIAFKEWLFIQTYILSFLFFFYRGMGMLYELYVITSKSK